jgi:hypothetical protein
LDLNIKNYLLENILYKKLNNFRIAALFIFLLIITSQTLFSQEKVKINANDIGLNKVIVHLRDFYNLNVSFNDDKLSSFKVNANKEFSTPEKALKYLLKGLPLKLESLNNVFVISDLKQNKPLNYLLTGNISEAISNETLPFSTIVINGLSLISDQKGLLFRIFKTRYIS